MENKGYLNNNQNEKILILQESGANRKQFIVKDTFQIVNVWQRNLIYNEMRIDQNLNNLQILNKSNKFIILPKLDIFHFEAVGQPIRFVGEY
ncbi:hypothetical protein T10_5791 [Trichinella papuae]|uniref:Uncharacterized protein n=1 Tax=Trichinella papuae TaxID=268474 RepID=A0A0V1MIF9_9BILA|nr:hypothetical protein T10_5791 [Trichinella papuae]